MKIKDLHILSISQFGSGLAETNIHFSGALDRQKDYALSVNRYSIVVPSKRKNNSPIWHADNLVVYPIKSRNLAEFIFLAYLKVLLIHKELPINAVMIDNPFLCALLGILIKVQLKVILVVHSMSDMIANKWFTKESFRNRILSLFLPITLRGSDLIRVSTEHEITKLKEVKFLRDKLVKVPFYIKPNNEENFKAQNHNLNQLLYVGRLEKQKDLSTLFHAIKIAVQSHEDIHFILVGDGGQKKKLQNLAAKLQIERSVSFVGKVAHKDVNRYFNESALFVISSIHEGTCMVLHEAAAAHLPIISTDFAGAVDFIRDGTEGYLVPIGDYNSFAQKIIEFLNNPSNGRRMGDAAYERLEYFTREKALSQWNILCERISDLLTLRKTQEFN